MNVFDQPILNIHLGPDEAKQWVTVYLVLSSLITIAGVIWIYRDAKARGKNSVAAALVIFLSAFHGLSVLLIVMCVWILSRPERIPRAASDLPLKLPSGIVAGPAPDEFLEDLENQTEFGDPSDVDGEA